MADISKHEFKKLCEAQIKLQIAYCCLCGKPIYKIKDYNVEHLLPTSRGGRNDPSNWRMAHKTCNSEKGALTFEEYKLWLELESKRHGHSK
jgi:5-methylcytosine-specific restriction endonuclease McrA